MTYAHQWARGYGKTAAVEGAKLALGGSFALGIDGQHAVLSSRMADGTIHVVGEFEFPVQTDDRYDIIQGMVLRAYEAMVRRNEQFLKDAFHITPSEERGVRDMDPVIVERITKRMNEGGDLPVNFWQTVAAHKMLEDKEGRRLVADIIARKVGCDGQRSSD